MDPIELVEELRCIVVTDARNIFQTRNGTKTKTAAIILTFSKAILPKSIGAGYTKIKVEPYISNPLRCFTCQGLVIISPCVSEIRSVPDVVNQIMAQTHAPLHLNVLTAMVTTPLMRRHVLSG